MSDQTREEIALQNAQHRMSDVNLASVQTRRSSILEKSARIPLLKGVLAEVGLVMDLVRDYWSGRYRNVPRWVIGAITFALLYFINPIELIPEFVPVIGYLDDIALLLLVLRLTRDYVARYRAWRDQEK